MNILYFGALVLTSLFLYNLYGWVLSRSVFWRGLSRDYSCSVKEFRDLPRSALVPGRFVFCVENRWKSNDYVFVKVDDEYLYFGVDFWFSLSIGAIKIPKNKIHRSGVKRHLLRARRVYRIESSDGVCRGVALLSNV